LTDLSLENVDFPDEVSEDEEFDDVRYQKFVNSSFADWGFNQLVGHGPVANDKCSTYRGRYGCLHTELHEFPLLLLGEKKWEGQVFQHPVFYSCHRLSCPKCFRSAMVREARAVEGRLVEAEKFHGRAEHIVASVPLEYYYLANGSYSDFLVMRGLALKALARRDVVGGAMFYHAFREDKSGHWYPSPHFHILGFILGGYRCRVCVKQFCSECHGFEGLTRRCFEKDGFIVKIAQDWFSGVAGERKSLYNTAKYQLSHASIRTDVKRPHVVTWFGVCSYRRLKFKYVLKKAVCPYCGGVLVRVRYLGSKYFCVDRDSSDFVSSSHEDLVEEGVVLWEEIVAVSYRG